MKRWTSLLALVLLPAPAAAQAVATVAPYVATDGTVVGDPVVVGATISWELGHLGMRWGVGVDAGSVVSSAPGVGEGPDGQVNADLDAVLYLAHPRGSAAVIPYAVAGLGVRAVHMTGRTAAGAVWGAGGGVRTPLAGRLALDGEAVYRRPVVEPEPGAWIQEGMEYRLGLSLRVGRSAPRVAPTPPPLSVPRSMPPRPSAGVGGSAARDRVARSAIAEAERHLGVGYRWGGNEPSSGFDCSGFIRYVYRLQGVDLPRVSHDQARAGLALPLDISVLEPGDLIAFASRGAVDHVAIYAGNGRIIHSSSSGGGVRYDDLNTNLRCNLKIGG
jgi:cell wall-associated NlpC family hydrolase